MRADAGTEFTLGAAGFLALGVLGLSLLGFFAALGLAAWNSRQGT